LCPEQKQRQVLADKHKTAEKMEKRIRYLARLVEQLRSGAEPDKFHKMRQSESELRLLSDELQQLKQDIAEQMMLIDAHVLQQSVPVGLFASTSAGSSSQCHPTVKQKQQPQRTALVLNGGNKRQAAVTTAVTAASAGSSASSTSAPLPLVSCFEHERCQACGHMMVFNATEYRMSCDNQRCGRSTERYIGQSSNLLAYGEDMEYHSQQSDHKKPCRKFLIQFCEDSKVVTPELLRELSAYLITNTHVRSPYDLKPSAVRAALIAIGKPQLATHTLIIHRMLRGENFTILPLALIKQICGDSVHSFRSSFLFYRILQLMPATVEPIQGSVGLTIAQLFGTCESVEQNSQPV